MVLKTEPLKWKLIKKDLNLDDTSSLSDIKLLLKNNPNVLTILKDDGDFRSQECIDILETVDILITHPPFSLFKEYIHQLFEYEKKFLIIGPGNAFATKYFFKFVKNNKVWKGYTEVRLFLNPDGRIEKCDAYWYTNLNVDSNKRKFVAVKKYDPEEYQKYLNYDAIECNKINNIPYDYYGKIGVSCSIFDYDYQEDFELIRMDCLLEKLSLEIKHIGTNRVLNKGLITSGFCLECGEEKN